MTVPIPSRQIAAVITAVTFAASMVAASVRAAAEPSIANAPLEFRSNLFVDRPLEDYIKRMRSSFLQQDADGDGRITQRDVDFVDQLQRARMRAVSLEAVMTCDLDGDGFVTESEARRTSEYFFRTTPDPQRQQLEINRYVDGIMALDADKDGKVSFLETRYLASPHVAQMAGFAPEIDRIRTTLRLSTASGGELTLQQYEAAAEAFFRAVDTNSDGKISQQERDRVPLQDMDARPGILGRR